MLLQTQTRDHSADARAEGHVVEQWQPPCQRHRCEMLMMLMMLLMSRIVGLLLHSWLQALHLLRELSQNRLPENCLGLLSALVH